MVTCPHVLYRLGGVAVEATIQMQDVPASWAGVTSPKGPRSFACGLLIENRKTSENPQPTLS